MQSAGGTPHVLYVAWGFPPCRGGGVYRALATANGFAQQGFRVTVLTADREAFTRFTGVDVSLEALVDPRIEIVRVPFEWPTLETDVRRWSALRALAPRVWRKVRVRLDKIPFPEVGYGPWRKPLETAALRIHQEDPVDLVVASANPNVDFTVADRLHRDHN
ncbi:MAG TPA: glycosyl transferase, partial [Dermatophilaceae bacterium]